MHTSSYKAVGGDGRGGEAGYGCHHCRHGNDQTGESWRRKHRVNFMNVEHFSFKVTVQSRWELCEKQQHLHGDEILRWSVPHVPLCGDILHQGGESSTRARRGQDITDSCQAWGEKVTNRHGLKWTVREHRNVSKQWLCATRLGNFSGLWNVNLSVMCGLCHVKVKHWLRINRLRSGWLLRFSAA